MNEGPGWSTPCGWDDYVADFRTPVHGFFNHVVCYRNDSVYTVQPEKRNVAERCEAERFPSSGIRVTAYMGSGLTNRTIADFFGSVAVSYFRVTVVRFESVSKILSLK